MSPALVSSSSFNPSSSFTFNRPTKKLPISSFFTASISYSFKSFSFPLSHPSHKIFQFVKPIRNQTESDSNTINNTNPFNDRWSLRGMTALVTGGTRGIGHAIVEELAGFGARVYTCSRNESDLVKCLRDWDNLKFGVSGSVCDVSIRAQREELMENVSSTFDGKLNILVRSIMLVEIFGSLQLSSQRKNFLY